MIFPHVHYLVVYQWHSDAGFGVEIGEFGNWSLGLVVFGVGVW